MTRVWSLATDEKPKQTQFLIMWKNQTNLFSFDSGYESSSNSLPTNDLQDLDEDDSHEEVHDQHQEEVETINLSNRRVQSSPIPIPRNRKYKKTSRNPSQNSSPISLTSSGYSSLHSLSFSPQSLNNDLIGHPPCNCGCIRGYRNPYFIRNISLLNDNTSDSERLMSVTLSSSNYETERNDSRSERCWYPLPDIVSSSLSQNSTFINGITREIGADLRRISKDFITARNQKIETNKISLITRLTGIAIPYILKEVMHYFK